MGHLANINSPNPFSKELSTLISLAHRPLTHSLSDIPVCLDLCRADTRRHCGPYNVKRSCVSAVDHYSLLRYVPSFDFPLKRNRSQFSLFLSGNGSLVSRCHVDLKPTEVLVVREIGDDKRKRTTFTWLPVFTFTCFLHFLKKKSTSG